jgi:DNA-binding CsgD family transcriptional regulator
MSTMTDNHRDPAPSATEGWHFNPYFFFGFVGIVFYASWLFLSYFSVPLLAHPFSTEPIALVSQMATAIIAMLTLAVFWLFSDALSTTRGRLLLLTLSISFGPVATLMSTHEIMGLISWVSVMPMIFSGIGYASLLLLWSTLLIALDDKHITLFLASALIAGALVCAFIVSLISAALFFAAAILPILSAACFIISHRFRQQTVDPETAVIVVSAAESDEKDPISWKLIADTLTYTPCLGIGIFLALRDFSYPFNIACILMATIVSCVIIIIDNRYLHFLSSKNQLKLFLPLAAVIVFPLSFATGVAELILIFLLFSVFMLSLVTNYSAISLCVGVFALSPLRVFAYGRAFNLLGVLLGFFFAAFAFSEPLVQNNGTIFAFCILILIFIFATTFILEDHYPTSSDVGSSDEQAEMVETSSRDSWDERCKRVARHYSLSPRQSEVFNLLAKGRNAAYIQEHLAISHCTTKAHIYNIYQKIDIHSRQELLTLIEQTELD